MPAHPIHQVADPHSGEMLSLREVADRYGHEYTTIHDRHRRGKRGIELIAPIDETHAKRSAKRKPRQPTPAELAAERRERIRRVLADPRNQPLTQPLVRRA
ncbi:hypothetical protein EQG41_19680 [Billgrantia azerbaijanica]|nr:hypothetical protein EQG41_19680 [Halomonas azerbaijanica]